MQRERSTVSMNDMAESRAQAVLSWVASFPGARIHPELKVRMDCYGGMGLFIDGGRDGRGAEDFLPGMNRQASALEAGEELFSIPRECMLESPLPTAAGLLPLSRSERRGTGREADSRSDVETEPSTLSQGSVVYPHWSPQGSLALELLRQRSLGAASRWAAYIAALPGPQDLSHIPLLAHMQELLGRRPPSGDLQRDDNPAGIPEPSAEGEEDDTASVRGLLACSPSALAAFDELWRQVLTEYEDLVLGGCSDCSGSGKEVPSFSRASSAGSINLRTAVTPTLEEYCWARCIVSSRAIHLWSGPTLVPLADFLNDRRPPKAMVRCFSPPPNAMVRCFSPPPNAMVRCVSPPPNAMVRCFSPPPNAKVRCVSAEAHHDHTSDHQHKQGEAKVTGRQRHCRSIYSPPDTSEEEEGDGDEMTDSSSSSRDEEEASANGEEGNKSEDMASRQVESLDSDGSFVCEATRNLDKGDEVFWVYNAHAHDMGWLLGYGFIPIDGTSTPSLSSDVDLADTDSIKAIDRALTLIADLPAGPILQRRVGIEMLLTRVRKAMMSLACSHQLPEHTIS